MGKTCTSEQEDHYSLKFEIVDRVQLPSDLPEGNYHLGFRWDCEQTPQVWSSCADVRVTSAPGPPPAPLAPSSGKYLCKGIPYSGNSSCVQSPFGYLPDAITCDLACGSLLPPSPPSPPHAPFSKECLRTLEAQFGKFTPHGEKTDVATCNNCIAYHATDVVPVCGGWSPKEGGKELFQEWCRDAYVPPA